MHADVCKCVCVCAGVCCLCLRVSVRMQMCVNVCVQFVLVNACAAGRLQRVGALGGGSAWEGKSTCVFVHVLCVYDCMDAGKLVISHNDAACYL